MKKIYERQYSETQVFYEYDGILYEHEEDAIAKQQADYEDVIDSRFAKAIRENAENADRVAEERAQKNRQITRHLKPRK